MYASSTFWPYRPSGSMVARETCVEGAGEACFKEPNANGWIRRAAPRTHDVQMTKSASRGSQRLARSTTMPSAKPSFGLGPTCSCVGHTTFGARRRTLVPRTYMLVAQKTFKFPLDQEESENRFPRALCSGNTPEVRKQSRTRSDRRGRGTGSIPSCATNHRGDCESTYCSSITQTLTPWGRCRKSRTGSSASSNVAAQQESVQTVCCRQVLRSLLWLTMAAPNTVAFPSARSARSSVDNISAWALAHHQTAAEICELFYGASPPAWQSVERFYDPNATYENPFITATSKDTIGDVHALARYLSQLDVPKPWAVLCALFRLSEGHRWRDAWFRGVSMWNEINDISECESFGEFSNQIQVSLSVSALFPRRPLCMALALG